jgi:predicted nuclease of predicted toxin-antitoxin system
VRILLDESLPRRLKRDLVNHEVVTVPEMGWAGKANGDLLTLARDRFDAFLTADQNLEYQQRLTASDVAVIVLTARSNRYHDLRLLVPRVLEVLAGQLLAPGKVVRVTAEGGHA